MEPDAPIQPEPLIPVTLTVEISNTRTDRGRRLRNRSESYFLGAEPALPVYDPFSFCCWRALLLGSPAVVIRATAMPGRRGLLSEPLPPQPLFGEAEVEGQYWSNRTALSFLMQGRGGRADRRFFGFRASHFGGGFRLRGPETPWLHYRPSDAILDAATGRPPTFAGVDDFRVRSQSVAGGAAPTREQAWATFFWLLVNRTYFVSQSNGLVGPWDADHGIQFRGYATVKAGR
jgi:hypothetical protein